MKKLWERLLCRIGLHRLKINGEALQIPGSFDFIAPYLCERKDCGKVKFRISEGRVRL